MPKLWMLASPHPSRCDRPRLFGGGGGVWGMREREMETFLASLLNLSTSYRELRRNALFFFNIQMSVNQTGCSPRTHLLCGV